MNKITIIAFYFLALCLPTMASALQPIDDAELSNITGQDGLVLDLASKGNQTGFGYDDITLTVDRNSATERKLQFKQAPSQDFPGGLRPGFYTVDDAGARSEEHTSELWYRVQSSCQLPLATYK